MLASVAATRRSLTCTGSFRLDLDPGEAIRLFTPEGERAWVEGWDPAYPDPDADPDAPGTVFLTAGEGGERTQWMIVAAGADERRYARFDPRGLAALVEVRCAAGAGGTRVEVTYSLTALAEDAEAHLAAFAAGYDAYLESWREAIEAAIERGAIVPGDASRRA
jgi:hypothetical protein